MPTSNKIAIIHFQPLEAYPPVMNVLRFLPKAIPDAQWMVASSSRDFGLTTFKSKNPNVKIQRLIIQSKKASRILRLVRYSLFCIRTFFALLIFRPNKVLYYESISSFPAIWYKRLFKKIELYIHYHEYTSPEEYAKGMVFNRLAHKAERRMLAKADWVSHTNVDRLRFFLNDIDQSSSELPTHTLPNHPPESWFRKRKSVRTIEGSPVKLVYVWSMGFDTTYIKEVCDWVISSNGQFSLDVFSYQMEDAVRGYFNELEDSAIQLHPPIDYINIPDVLQSFDVGLILYKGHIPNYIYNAPNKLFEYHICGLEVWFPNEMEGCKVIDETVYGPAIRCVNFKDLENFDWELSVKPGDEECTVEYPYTYQKTLATLAEHLK